jgi:hypothetical protein
MLQSQEEGGVRTLAVTAWARARIMDGNWVTPGDIWCVATGQVPPDSLWDPSLTLPTMHPVPYLLQTSPSNESASLPSSEMEDPLSAEPSQQAVHYPATDSHTPIPSLRFAQLTSNYFRTTFRDILLDPMRHAVCRLMIEAQAGHQDPCVRLAKLDMDDVLAVLLDERTWYVDSGNGPRLVHAIPFVPVSTHNMAPITRTLLEGIWREACAPLFQCRCSICDRALRNQGQGGRSNVAQPAVMQAQPQPPSSVIPSHESSRQIILVENEPTPANSPSLETGHPSPPTVAPSSDAGSIRSRKRSSAEIDDSEESENVIEPHDLSSVIPRKRRRTNEMRGDEDAAMSSEPDSPADVDSREGTRPGSPANSTGVPSETSLSSSSASDSSSLRSIASDTSLSALPAIDKPRLAVNDLKSVRLRAETIKVHGYDEETLYDDVGEGVVYLP